MNVSGYRGMKKWHENLEEGPNAKFLFNGVKWAPCLLRLAAHWGQNIPQGLPQQMNSALRSERGKQGKGAATCCRTPVGWPGF